MEPCPQCKSSYEVGSYKTADNAEMFACGQCFIQWRAGTSTTPRSARFRLVQDDSSHWYAIPADKSIAFDAWVLALSDEGENYVPYEGEEFDEYRLNMHPRSYSFCNLKED